MAKLLILTGCNISLPLAASFSSFFLRDVGEKGRKGVKNRQAAAAAAAAAEMQQGDREENEREGEAPPPFPSCLQEEGFDIPPLLPLPSRAAVSAVQEGEEEKSLFLSLVEASSQMLRGDNDGERNYYYIDDDSREREKDLFVSFFRSRVRIRPFRNSDLSPLRWRRMGEE